MLHLLSKLFSLLPADRRAVTMLEYGIIAALVAVTAIGGLTGLGTSVNGKFVSVAGKIANP